MADEDLFWAYFSTPGLESSSLLLALVQNNMDRTLKVMAPRRIVHLGGPASRHEIPKP